MVNDEWIDRVVIRVFYAARKSGDSPTWKDKKLFVQSIFLLLPCGESRERERERDIFTLMCCYYYTYILYMLCFDREMLIT